MQIKGELAHASLNKENCGMRSMSNSVDTLLKWRHCSGHFGYLRESSEHGKTLLALSACALPDVIILLSPLEEDTSIRGHSLSLISW